MVNGGLYFNPAAFAATLSNQFGNAPRYLDSVLFSSPGQYNTPRQIQASLRLRF